jgi:hypothetical protein
MNARCEEFRAELEAALAGASGALARLASQAHAGECPACRAELARELALDALLDRAPAPAAPSSLARRVLAALAPQRSTPLPDDGELDELLARVPAPRAPAALSRRVLHALAPVRAPRGRRSDWRPGRRPGRRQWLVAAAAMLLGWLALWIWVARRPAEERPGLVDVPEEPEALEADEELVLYTVERWELLNDADLDLWLASLDPLDELFIEYTDGETLLEEGPARARKE